MRNVAKNDDQNQASCCPAASWPAGTFPRRILFALLLAGCLAFDRSAAEESLPTSEGQSYVSLHSEAVGFVSSHCADCHADGVAEGGLDFDELEFKLKGAADLQRWVRIYDRVAAGEMPPPDSGDVSDEQRQRFMRALGESLTEKHNQERTTVLRRLNRREYENTLNDLFGTHERLQQLLPDDGRSHEFDNVGAALSVSAVQMEAYLVAVEQVLDAAIAKTVAPPEPVTIQANYAETREGEKHLGTAWKLAEDGAVVFFRPLGYPTGMLRTSNVRRSGRYRIRITGYAYQSEVPVTFAVGGTSFQRGSSKPTYGYFELPPGDPTTIELEAWIETNYMLEITPWGISDDDYEIKKNGIDAYQGPGLAIKQVELHGPLLEQFPSRGHQLLFADLTRSEVEPANPSVKKKSWYVPKFEIAPADDLKGAIDETLVRVAEAAFRRQVELAELTIYRDLFEQQVAEGATVEEALRAAVAAIFCAPDFLYLLENPEGISPGSQLNDAQLATRLSYFLARTTPDEALRSLAREKRLTSDRGLLRLEAQRLIDDKRFDRFVKDFSDSWLDLRNIEFTSPDKNLYPEFDAFLQFSMVDETTHFLRHWIRNNRPVMDIVNSDYAFLNNRLSQHYGEVAVEGPSVKKVALDASSSRGGLLTQASVLKVTANGTNTSPVVRGAWVLERIFGTPPPPPPPGVPGVEPDIRGASTLREMLEKHRSDSNCKSCHQLIDPPGFALECFDPIGGYRENYRSLGEGEKVEEIINARKVRYRVGLPVDASGQTLDGETFEDFRTYRNWLSEQEARITRTVIEKLLTFGTGRELGFADRAPIEDLVQRCLDERLGMRDIVIAVVESELFRSK